MQRPTHREGGLSLHANDIDPPDAARQQGRWSITSTTLKGVRGFCLFDEEIPTSQRHDATLHRRHKSDKELPFLAPFLSLSPW
jgi:hypothetical protein